MKTTALSRFKFVGSGIYLNEMDNVSVMLNEDYKRTFSAYAWHRPHFRHVMRNKAGNPIRFRSAEAAAEHALKHKPRISPLISRAFDAAGF